MHSFAPSLSFLLSFFLLPLLHWPHIGVRLATFDGLNSQPPAANRGLGLQLARAAELNYAVLQDNASNNLIQPSGDNAAPPTGRGGAVKQAKILNLGLEDTGISSGGGHSHLTPPPLRRRHAALNHARDAAVGCDNNNTNTHAPSHTDVTLHPGKRASNAKFTNFVTGQGACGGFNVASDFVVALNTEQWDNGAHCYATITITINGKSTQAQIVDECPGCGYNNLDLTDGLFDFWVNINEQGTLFGDWEWGSGAQPTPTPTPTPPPKTTQRPTSTWKSATTSSAAASSSTVSSATSNSTAPASTQRVVQVQSGNLELMYLSTVGMGGLLMSTLNFSS